MKVSIVYWSGTGNTEAMANAVAEGAKNAGAEVELLPVSAASADVVGSDTLLFGCPAMGSEELEESEFEPFFSSVEGSLSGKKVGLFGSYDWGDGEWMRTWQQRVEAAGGVMIEDGLICNNTPEYAQNHIGSRGDALRNVRNARQRCSAPRGGREKGRVLPRKGQDGSHRRGRRGYYAHQGGDHRAGLYGRRYPKSAL